MERVPGVAKKKEHYYRIISPAGSKRVVESFWRHPVSFPEDYRPAIESLGVLFSKFSGKKTQPDL